MKTKIATSLFALALPLAALGLSAEIGGPEIGHPAEISEEQIEKVDGVLEFLQEHVEFLDGRFINQFINSRYDGKGERVVELIELAKDAEIWEVVVGFRDFEEQDTAFTLHQDGSERLSIVINSGRVDFKLRDFRAYLQAGVGMRFPVPEETDGEVGANK